MPSYPSYHNIINLTKSGISTCRHAQTDAAARISIKESFAEKASKKSQFIMLEITSVTKKGHRLFFCCWGSKQTGRVHRTFCVCVCECIS